MKFTFDDSINPRTGKKRHDYFLDDKKMTGVTSVLNVIAKNNLIQWSADLAAIAGLEAEQIIGIKKEYDAIQIIEDWKEKKQAKLALDKKYPIYKTVRTSHITKRDDAGQKGTDVHAEIEMIIKDVINKKEGLISESLHGNSQVQHFINWAETNKVKFLESEKKMYSENKFFAGTADFTCEIDSKKYVGDIKTSSGIYGREPFFQVAAYRFMLEEMNEKDFNGSVIVNIKKSGVFDEQKDVHWSFDYATDLRGFLSALELYRIINNY